MIKSLINGISALFQSGLIFRAYSVLGITVAILVSIKSPKLNIYPDLLGRPFAYVFMLLISPAIAFFDRKSKEYGEIKPKFFLVRTLVNFTGATIFFVCTCMFIFVMFL